MVSKEVSVKHGCKIMYLHNHPFFPLVNGSVGEFLLINGTPYMHYKGRDYPLDKVEFEYREYQLVTVDDIEKPKLVTVSSIEQYPIKLCYAISVHKSQGLSLEEITLDLRVPLFAENQLYVALSRVKSPEGLCILK